MGEQEIQQEFLRAGWELDGSFSDYLIIGDKDDLSILAYCQTWESGDLQFQLYDHENDRSCWVREIVSPERAALLLHELGEPALEEYELRA